MTEEKTVTVTRETFSDEIAVSIQKAMDNNVKYLDIVAILQSSQISVIIMMLKSAEKAGVV